RRAGIHAARLEGIVIAQERRRLQYHRYTKTPCRSVEGHRQGGSPALAPQGETGLKVDLAEQQAEMSSPSAIPLNANAQSVLKSRWPFSPAPIIRHANGRWPAPRAPKTPLGQGSRQVVHDLSHVLYSAGRGDGAQIGLSA